MDTRAPSISSSALTLRARHSATVVGNKIYLFGGHGTNSKPYSDLYVMELDNFSWTKYSSDKVRALAYTQTHTRTYIRMRAHIHAHAQRRTSRRRDTNTCTALRATGDADVELMRYSQTWPESRAGHTLTSVPDKGYMIGFGGHNNKQKYYNGVFLLERGAHFSAQNIASSLSIIHLHSHTNSQRASPYTRTTLCLSTHDSRRAFSHGG